MIADTTAPGCAHYGDLYEAVELARQAAQAEAGEHPVGQYVENQTEPSFFSGYGTLGSELATE